MRNRYLAALGSLLWLVLAAAFSAPAQTTYGKIVGNARDISNSVVSGAKVTVINEGTSETHTQLTNELGAYAFNTLILGSYSIQAEMSGFRPIRIEHITLQVNQTARSDLVLEVGQVSESINVTAAAQDRTP